MKYQKTWLPRLGVGAVFFLAVLMFSSCSDDQVLSDPQSGVPGEGDSDPHTVSMSFISEAPVSYSDGGNFKESTNASDLTRVTNDNDGGETITWSLYSRISLIVTLCLLIVLLFIICSTSSPVRILFLIRIILVLLTVLWLPVIILAIK